MGEREREGGGEWSRWDGKRKNQGGKHADGGESGVLVSEVEGHSKVINMRKPLLKITFQSQTET